MRLAVLTTQTPHHSWFVQRLAEASYTLRVLVETRVAPQAYPTSHAFELERDEYEWARWFQGVRTEIADIAPTIRLEDINEPRAISALDDFGADAIVVFGTGRIRPPLIALQPAHILNLHGGNPESYRGLDTHLWAIWHRDFEGLVTTLHLLDHELDNGAIVLQEKVPVGRGMKLGELRAANTERCVELTLRALKDFSAVGSFATRPQRHVGRYYSAMPAVLKEISRHRFAHHTERL